MIYQIITGAVLITSARASQYKRSGYLALGACPVEGCTHDRGVPDNRDASSTCTVCNGPASWNYEECKQDHITCKDCALQYKLWNQRECRDCPSCPGAACQDCQGGGRLPPRYQDRAYKNPNGQYIIGAHAANGHVHHLANRLKNSMNLGAKAPAHLMASAGTGAQENCSKCNGSGRGRFFGNCSKCKGSGTQAAVVAKKAPLPPAHLAGLKAAIQARHQG